MPIMENSEIFRALASVFGFIGGASIVAGIVLRRIDRFEKKLDKREQDRIRENMIAVELLTGCADLSSENTAQLRKLSGKTCCKDELEAVKASREHLDEFIREKSAEYLHSR